MASGRNRALVLEIVADTDKSSRELQGFTSKLKGLAAGFIAAFGAREVVRGITDAVNAASDLAESSNAVSKVFKDNATQIEAFGKRAADAVGLSRREVNELAVVVGGQLKNLGMEDYTAQTIELTERAADMASVFNTSVADAVQAIGSGLRGESEPLRKFNVNLSRSAIVAKAAADGITEAQAAVTLIMEQTADTAGDFADTADDMANAGRRLAASWENLQADAGKYLIPATEAVLGFANAMVGGGGIEDGVARFLIGAQQFDKAAATIADSAVGFATFGTVNLGLADRSNELQKLLVTQSTFNQRLRAGEDIAQSVGKAYLELAVNYGLTADNTVELRRNLGRTNDELAAGLELAIKNADQYGLTATEVQLLTDAYNRATGFTRDFGQSFEEYTGQMAADANRNLVDDPASATAAVERMRSRWEAAFTDIGEAWARLQLTPKRATLDIVTIGIGDDRPREGTADAPGVNPDAQGGGTTNNYYLAPGTDPYSVGQAIANAEAQANIISGNQFGMA